MTSKLTITDERIEKIALWLATESHSLNLEMLTCLRELQERRKAAMDSEPVAWMHNNNNIGIPAITTSPKIGQYWMTEFKDVHPLYRHAQPALTPYAWSYDWAHCVTCEGPQDFKPVIEREPPPQWAIDEGRVKNLITLYRTAQPAPVVPDEVEHVAAVLELIGSFEAADIDSDTVDLRFEIDDVGTGSDASITEYAARGAAIIRMLAGNPPVIGIDMASGPDHSVEVRYVAPPGYVMVPKEPTDDMCFAPDVRVGNKTWDGYQSSADMAECKAIYKAMLAATPQPQSEPQNIPEIIPGWIPVSERMPDDNSDVLCTAEFDGPGDWRRKVGYWHEGKWVVYGASWMPTHWMPLPAGPQEAKDDINALISLVSRNEQEVKGE